MRLSAAATLFGVLLLLRPSPAQSCVGTIGIHVFDDLNGNGALDGGEPGMPGVSVEISGVSGVGSVTLTAVTDANGDAVFSDVFAGVSIAHPTYRARIVVSRGLRQTTANPPDQLLPCVGPISFTFGAAIIPAVPALFPTMLGLLAFTLAAISAVRFSGRA